MEKMVPNSAPSNTGKTRFTNKNAMETQQWDPNESIVRAEASQGYAPASPSYIQMGAVPAQTVAPKKTGRPKGEEKYKISLYFPTEKKDMLDVAVRANGKKSVNEYIVGLIQKDIDQNGEKYIDKARRMAMISAE